MRKENSTITVSGDGSYESPMVLDRTFVLGLFKEAMGCTTAATWDDDALVRRLKRLPGLIGGNRLETAAFAPYLEVVDRIRKRDGICSIIIKSNEEPVADPVSIIDKPIRIGPRRKVKGKTSKRRDRFSFKKCGIPKGATLTLKRDRSVTCTVIGDPWNVDFGDGKWTSFTARTKELIGAKETTYLSPMYYWEYNGVLLRDYYEKWQARKAKSGSQREEVDGEGDYDAENIAEVSDDE